MPHASRVRIPSHKCYTHTATLATYRNDDAIRNSVARFYICSCACSAVAAQRRHCQDENRWNIRLGRRIMLSQSNEQAISTVCGGPAEIVLWLEADMHEAALSIAQPRPRFLLAQFDQPGCDVVVTARQVEQAKRGIALQHLRECGRVEIFGSERWSQREMRQRQLRMRDQNLEHLRCILRFLSKYIGFGQIGKQPRDRAKRARRRVQLAQRRNSARSRRDANDCARIQKQLSQAWQTVEKVVEVSDSSRVSQAEELQ